MKMFEGSEAQIFETLETAKAEKPKKGQVIFLDEEEFWDSVKTADILQICRRTLENIHARREGPPQIRIGAKIWFRKSSVLSWLLNQEAGKKRSRRAA